MEALGGYASSGSSEEEEEMATAAAAAGVPQSNAAALAAEAARAERVAAMEKSDSDESEDSDESDSSDDSDDDEREAQEAGFRRGASKAAAVSLPSASELMAGGGDGGAGIYHNPYEQQEIHTKRKLGDNEDNTIFKKIQGKKKVYGQGPKPKTNSSVARSWTSGVGGALLPPQVARGRANTVTEDTSAWNVTKKKMAPTGMYSKQFEGASGKPMGLDLIDRAAAGSGGAAKQ